MNSIELDSNELQTIEDMASMGFVPGEIAEVLEISPTVLQHYFKDADSDIYKRYRKGYLLGQYKLRQRIAKDAAHGSSPAQTLMKKIYDECEYQLKQL